MPYKFIEVRSVMPNAEYTKELEKELNLAQYAPEMAQALREISEVIEAITEKSNSKAILKFIQGRADNTLKLLDGE